MEFAKNIQSKNICLESGAANLGYGPLKIQMCEGTGWINDKGEDVFINAGEKYTVDVNQHPIIISSPNRSQRIVFEVDQTVIAMPKQKSRLSRLVASFL